MNPKKKTLQQELNSIEVQTIKSARFSHRLLLTVCLTAVIFGFSPQERSIYKDAVRELNILETLDFRKLIFDVVSKNKQFEELNSTFLKVESILSDFGLSLAPITDRGSLFSIQPYGVSINSDSLEEIYTVITNTNELSVELTKVDNYFEKDLRGFLKKRRQDYKKWGKTVAIQARKDNFVVSWHHDNSGSTTTGDSFTQPPEKKKFRVKFDLCSTIRNYPDWKVLVASINGDCLFLPNLKKVWDQVRDESISHARAILARKDIKQETQLKIFGLSIPQSLISWTIPLLICCLSIYFLVHILNLEDLAKRNSLICQYPWEVIMPGFLAMLVSTASLLFPIIAFLSISYATWNGQSAFIQILTTILFIITTIAIGVTIKKIMIIKSYRSL